MQRIGPVKIVLRGACARVKEQALAAADRASRAVLRSATYKERDGGGKGGAGGGGEKTAAS